MPGPNYPPARAVAERIQARLAASTVAFQEPPGGPKPDFAAIEEIVSTAFWASLQREEGRSPKISLAFLPPEQSGSPLTFEPRLNLEPGVLARLAPAVERPGIHLGVWRYGGHLYVWGATRVVPMWCFVLEVVSPGLLVVKYRRAERGTKFANVAVLEGADVKFLKQEETIISDAPPALTPLLAFYSSAGRKESESILVRLAISMREHGRGGTVLIVPHETGWWRKSIVQSITYSVTPPFSEIRARVAALEGQDGEAARDALRDIVDGLAGLTMVDGAVVMSDEFDLLAFCVKILAPESARGANQVLLTEPVEGLPAVVVDPSHLGGTRHLSAVQFVHDQRDSIALVASQDGRFTVFAWSPDRQMVHAHRLEALLM
jgi:hypothetical protein